MGKGPGVSVSEREDGRYRVRWRDPDTGASRERVVADAVRAHELRAEILGALRDAAPTPAGPVAAVTVDSVLVAWTESVRGRRSSRTHLEYVDRSARVLRALRSVLGLRDDRAVPVAAVTRANVQAAGTALASAGLSEGTVALTVRTFALAWRWACSDTAAFPGLRPLPLDTAPPSVVYVAGAAPTMAHVDAMLVALVAIEPRAVPATVIGRCTGLRIGQVLSLTVGDVDLDGGTLAVRVGKSRAERRGRRVPIAPALAPYLAGLVDGRPATANVVGYTGKPDKVLHTAWGVASSLGAVPRDVWAPGDRAVARPTHALRAAFQSHLVRNGASDATIDALVGHAGGVRGGHYVGIGPDDARWPAMVAAVGTIPELPEEVV